MQVAPNGSGNPLCESRNAVYYWLLVISLPVCRFFRIHATTHLLLVVALSKGGCEKVETQSTIGYL
jgi:hypothetical protein